jgi:hypothetical protein
VGESNQTSGGSALFDPTGQTVPTSVLTTDGAIVRMRATLSLPEGTNSATSMTVTLPSGLSLDPSYATDGSVTVLLVSPNGDFTTTLTGTGLQLAEGGTAVTGSRLGLGNGGNTDPVTATLPAGDVGVSGQTITFNLGNLTNSDGSPLPNYAIVEFNAVVGNAAPATVAPLDTSMQGTASGHTTGVVDDFVSIQTPSLTLQKTVQGITYNPDGSATVTYTDTVTNNGNGPSYNVTITDPGAGTGTVSYRGTSGSGSGPTGTPNGSEFDGTVARLGAGQSQQFTYTVTIPPNQINTAVSDSTSQATVTWTALDPAHETGGQETLAGTSHTPATYSGTAQAGLDLVSGSVNQDLAPLAGTDRPLSPLNGQIVTVSYPGQTGTETVITGPDGTYNVLVPDNGRPISVTVTLAGNAPHDDVRDNRPDQTPSLTGTGATVTGSSPSVLTFTPAPNTSYTGVAFDFWHQPNPFIPPSPPPVPPRPDDTHGNGGWYTSDFLGRPIIPDLSLIGSVANRFIIVEQHAVISVPPNIFQDTLDNPQMTYEAKLPDGSPLPNWLSFDPQSLTFSGTPPAGAYGRLTILIRATDIAGNTADATFNILIGRRQEDLAALLAGHRRGGFHLPPGLHLGDAGRGLHDAVAALPPETRPADEPGMKLQLHADSALHRAAAMLDAPVPPVTGSGTFSGALRAAGPMGVLGRARALLDTLEAMTSNRPAA